MEKWVTTFSLCLNCFLLGIIFYVPLIPVPHIPEPSRSSITETTSRPLETTSDTKIKALLVNTSHCRMLAMDPMSPIVEYFMGPMKWHSCHKTKLLKPKTINGRNFLYFGLNREELWEKLGVRSLSEIFCAYNRLERVDDYSNEYVARGVFGFSRWRNFHEIKPSNSTLRVWCWHGHGRLLFHDVFMFLSHPKQWKKVKKPGSANSLSVLILGIDSISHMNYRRYFTKTISFVDELPHTEMWGYNRVGENSYPNVLPLLSGQNQSVVNGPAGCYGANKKNKNFDKCYLLFDFFKEAGYVTMFGEDTCTGGTFIYKLTGFKRQPADFYLRPVMYEIDENTSYDAWEAAIGCSGGRAYPEILDDFRRRLLPHMEARSRDKGFFGFFWQSHGVHDYLEYAGIADVQYESFLRELHRRKLLEDTFVLLMSDHGMRFGDFTHTLQGMKEMSLPTAVAIYPKWMTRRFPLAMHNLRVNAHRLMTTFDLHETLKDLANLDDLRDERIRIRTQKLRNERNVSLFLPIPEERSCTSAQIPVHFCQCNAYVKIPCNVHSIQRIARFVVGEINELLQPYPQCRQLELDDVEDAYRRDLNQTITVRLVTKPSGGRFDATVLATNITSLQGVITRTDQYKNQSFCVDEKQIQPYCYCL